MELGGREGQGLPPAGNRPPGAVQDKFPDLQPLGRGGVRPAQEGADAGQELSEPEGLGDVIVPAAVQAPHGIHLLVAAGEEQDGDAAGFPHLGAQGKAAAIGQQHVENQQIGGRVRPGEGCAGGGEAAAGGHPVALAGQDADQAVADIFVVLHQKDGFFHGRFPLALHVRRQICRLSFFQYTTSAEPAR